MKIAILGFGREGRSILRFLRKNPKYRRAEIQIRDIKLDKNYLKNLERFDLIFRSPGVPYTLPELNSAKKKGVQISSATKLFFQEARRRRVKIIGITGSKGKTTTATLLYKMLKAGGKRVFLAGNIGTSPLDILNKLQRNDWVVLELSSFQLQDIDISPNIAVVLEIFPEHQDAHRNVKEYYSAKANIARYQKKNDWIFFFQHHPISRKIAAKSRGKKIGVEEKNFKLFRPPDIKTPGNHTFQNAAMAATVAAKLGVKPKTIKRVAKTFPGVEHRLEFVRKIKGVSFYNDSASTNPHTAAAAIRSFPNQNKILLAGGYDKNLNYQPLAKALKNSFTRVVVLFGQNKNKIQKAIRRSGVPVKLVPNLKTAVSIAYQSAQKMPLAVVLLSPGAASFDQFQNYAERGKKFKQLVKSLK